MTNIVIGSVPIHGHVMPLLAVAAGLVERGHRVRFLTGGRFAEVVGGTGSRVRRIADQRRTSTIAS